jgi:hypothetical protein
MNDAPTKKKQRRSKALWDVVVILVLTVGVLALTVALLHAPANLCALFIATGLITALAVWWIRRCKMRQIHLSTAVVLTLLAGALLLANLSLGEVRLVDSTPMGFRIGNGPDYRATSHRGRGWPFTIYRETRYEADGAEPLVKTDIFLDFYSSRFTVNLSIDLFVNVAILLITATVLEAFARHRGPYM